MAGKHAKTTKWPLKIWKDKTWANTASSSHLGRGGMAQVYKAYHPQLDRYVAIKVMRSDLVEDAEFLARFRREARAVAALRHPHIVQIYDFDVQDDLYYMVMELLEGNTLKAYLNATRVRGERMPLRETARIFTDVLDGLAYAHGEGIIHRDLKPANIMLTTARSGCADGFWDCPNRWRDTIYGRRRFNGDPGVYGSRTRPGRSLRCPQRHLFHGNCLLRSLDRDRPI